MSKKDKLLASAQKNLKKKSLPRATKDFAKVVELDPNDMRSRQKLAELYSKTGNSLEAYEQYETVAKYFASNGFYLKAIAIYRQMQKLDPTQMSIHARLAELNEKQGLIGNAMSEYRELISYYEKHEMAADVGRTLEKMRELDPENLNIQLKLAEVQINSGLNDEGREIINSVLATLKVKQDYDRILKLYKKFLPMFPDDNEMQRGLAIALLEKGDKAKGLELLQQQLRDNPDDLELLRKLAATYTDMGDLKNSRLTYQHLLKLEPSDLEMREALIRCCLESQQHDQALSELEEWKESFQKAGQLEMLKTCYESLKEALPENQTVKQTLDSIYELTGDGDKILDIMSAEEDGLSYVVEDETVSDDLLENVEDNDEDEAIIDLGDFETESDSAEEEIDLEPLDDDEILELDDLEDLEEDSEDEIIDLEISDAMQVEAVEEDSLDLNFDFDEDEELDTGPDLQAELEEAEFYLQQGLFDEAERVCRNLLEQNPNAEECQLKLKEIEARRQSSDQQADASSELHNLATEVLEDGFSDLALDSLDNILGDDSVDLDDLLDISAGKHVIRTNVDDQIAADDMESHYNLGIAYREMGLFDDAISEFDKAQVDPARFVDCQTLKGLCYADKGDLEKSEDAFKAALDSIDIDDGQRLSLQYELGMLYENFQRPADALSSYRAVAAVDPDFRDVAEKIASLGDAAGSSDTGADKDRISFL